MLLSIHGGIDVIICGPKPDVRICQFHSVHMSTLSSECLPRLWVLTGIGNPSQNSDTVSTTSLKSPYLMGAESVRIVFGRILLKTMNAVVSLNQI